MKKISGGFLIAIEGIDGAGKTTQVIQLKQRLEVLGFDIVTFKEPTNLKYSKIFRNMAMHNNVHFRDPEKESNLFIEDRKIDVKKNIKPNLKKGKIVIMDRYYYSNMAYQGALGLDPEIIKEKNEKIAPIPNVAFILDVSPEVGINRIINKRGDKINNYERKSYLKKVRTYFKNMTKYPNVELIDGNSKRTIKEVADDIFNVVEKILGLQFNEDKIKNNEISILEYH